MLRTTIQFLSIFLTVGSSVLLLKGNLGIGTETIRELAMTKLTANPSVVQALASQQADTRVGLGLLLFAVALQIGNAAWPMRTGDFAVNPQGVFLAIGIAGLLMMVAWNLSERMATQSVAAVRTLIEEEIGEKTRDELWERP